MKFARIPYCRVSYGGLPMQISATNPTAAPIIMVQAAAAQSSLVVRVLSAAGSAFMFLASTAERVGAFGAGFATGITLMQGKPEALNTAAYAFIALSVINVAKCIFFGPGTFIYSVVADGFLGSMGFSTGLVIGCLGHLQR